MNFVDDMNIIRAYVMYVYGYHDYIAHMSCIVIAVRKVMYVDIRLIYVRVSKTRGDPGVS